MPHESIVVDALAQGRTMRQQHEAVKAKALARAVSDVVDGTLSQAEAMRSHGVSQDALRKALASRGWAAPTPRGKRKA
jgi:hypothetical protein